MSEPAPDSDGTQTFVEEDQESTEAPTRSRNRVPYFVLGGVTIVLALIGLMVRRAEARINKVALASRPQPVAIARTAKGLYRASRDYQGTLASWQEAGVGSQRIEAYVSDVLVRPGAVVHQGDLLATLDCRNSNAILRSLAAQARAIEAQEQALSHESVRVQSLLGGGYVSSDQAEIKSAQVSERTAQLAAEKAKVMRAALDVNDCILRAPFDGEVATRVIDPGAFVHPGTSLLTVVDRSKLRLVANAPEVDYPMLTPGKPVKVKVYAIHRDVIGVISRRTPSTDGTTRTIEFEVDIPDKERSIPTNTTGEVLIESDNAIASTVLPLQAASVRAGTAKVFIVDGSVVHQATYQVTGEIGGDLYVDPSLPPGTSVVLEGRELLEDGDQVTVNVPPEVVPSPNPESKSPGGAG